MDDIIERYSSVWGDDPRSLLENYQYHPELTKKLDAMTVEDFNQELLFEIVLWKLNRYPHIQPEIFGELKGIGKVGPKEHREAEPVLRKLLMSPGIRLPMASTILRFLNPAAFQIIDDRAYRVLHPGEPLYPAKPVNGKRLEKYLVDSTRIYFEYLDALHEVVSEKLPFQLADRILYQLDIELGNKIGSKG